MPCARSLVWSSQRLSSSFSLWSNTHSYACAYPYPYTYSYAYTESNVDTLSQGFRNAANELSASGGANERVVAQKITYAQLSQEIVNVKSGYDLPKSMWPAGFCPEGRNSIERAITGWDLALLLWNRKNNLAGGPTEPNFGGYDVFLAYGGSSLRVEVKPEGEFVKDRGKKYLPYDPNISILLGFAAGTSTKAKYSF